MRLASLMIVLLFAGCNALSVGSSYLPKPLKLPSKRKVIRDQLVVHSDFYLSRRHPLLDDLAKCRVDVVHQLRIPVSDKPIHVYLFENEATFSDYMKRKHPLFPSRRAFFVKSEDSLMVFAYWGSRIEEDLRHEVTHGYLHSAISDIPLWLDEGIAEYFETPRINSGFNSAHFHLLLDQYDSGDWSPDLARLERLKNASSLSQLDYAESWLWVHYLLQHDVSTSTLLMRHLQDITADPASAISLRQRLAQENRDVTELLSHLEYLRKTVKP